MDRGTPRGIQANAAVLRRAGGPRGRLAQRQRSSRWQETTARNIENSGIVLLAGLVPWALLGSSKVRTDQRETLTNTSSSRIDCGASTRDGLGLSLLQSDFSACEPEKTLSHPLVARCHTFPTRIEAPASSRSVCLAQRPQNGGHPRVLKRHCSLVPSGRIGSSDRDLLPESCRGKFYHLSLRSASSRVL